MRCTQVIGLGSHNPINVDLLDGEVYAYDGMFEDHPLFEYRNDFEIYREIVQASPWSSGPMLHIAIKRMSDGALFNYWKDDEICYD